MRIYQDNRLNIVMLSGYLGSGKTTWLRHALFTKQYGRAQVFTQEAAEQPVDDLLLSDAMSVTVLTGTAGTPKGKDELIAALIDIAELRTKRERIPLALSHTNPDTLIIETSGLADPAEIIIAIKEHPVLVYHFVLKETIIMADALHFDVALSTDVLCQQQLLSADRIIVTKSEEISTQSLSNLVSTLKIINPAAPISLSAYGVESALPPLPLPTENYKKLISTRFESLVNVISLSIPEKVNWVEFMVWLSALLHARGDNILRVKGVLKTDDGLLLLQSVRKIMQQPEVLPLETIESNSGDIVFIGSDLTEDMLLASIHSFLGLERL